MSVLPAGICMCKCEFAWWPEGGIRTPEVVTAFCEPPCMGTWISTLIHSSKVLLKTEPSLYFFHLFFWRQGLMSPS